MSPPATGQILHISDYCLPRLGGIEMQVHDLARHQRIHGHDVEIWTTTRDSPGAESAPGDVVVRRGQLTERDLRGRLRAARPRAVHAHVSVYSPYASRIAREAARLRIPTVITVHSMLSWLGPVPSAARAVWGVRRWPVIWSAVSERAAEPLQRMLGPEHTVEVLANSIDVASWACEPKPIEIPRVVSVLRFARLKRPVPLVRMLAEVRERLPADRPLRATLIGSGKLYKATQRSVDHHGLSDWIDLPGRMRRDEIRDVFAGSSLYVAPATLESFGIAALEARAAGLPVVASSLGGVGEFITPGADGLMASTDSGLVDAMVSLLGDPARLAAMQAHNRSHPPKHDWARGVAEAEALYRLAEAR